MWVIPRWSSAVKSDANHRRGDVSQVTGTSSAIVETRETRGLMFGALGVLGFSLTLPATKAAVADLDPTIAGLGRAVIAAALAAACLVATGSRFPARQQRRHLALVSLGVVIGFPLFTALALHRLSSAHGAVITGLLPAATAAFGVLLARERPSRAFWVVCLLGLVSVVLFAVTQGAGRPQAADLMALTAVVLGALGYAEGAVLARELGSWRVICWALVFALPVVVPAVVVAVAHAGLSARPSAWAGFAYVSIISMFLAFFAWYRGLAVGGVARVSQVQLAQPVLTLGWSALLLGEHIGLNPDRRRRRPRVRWCQPAHPDRFHPSATSRTGAWRPRPPRGGASGTELRLNHPPPCPIVEPRSYGQGNRAKHCVRASKERQREWRRPTPGVQGRPLGPAAPVIIGYLGLWTRGANTNRFQGVFHLRGLRAGAHLTNGVPLHDKSSVFNPRRDPCDNRIDFERPVDMREQLGSAFEVLEPNGRGDPVRVDLEDHDWLGDRGVEERTDALNLIAKRGMDEADLLETRTTRRYPVLTCPLGGFPIFGEGDVEDVPWVAVYQGSRRACPISPSRERHLSVAAQVRSPTVRWTGCHLADPPRQLRDPSESRRPKR